MNETVSNAGAAGTQQVGVSPEFLQQFAEVVYSDELRLRVEERPKDVLREHGFDFPPGVEVNVVFNTADTFHLAFPPDPNQELTDEALSAVAGGKTASSLSSAGSASSIPSTFSSIGCISSAASDADADRASSRARHAARTG